MKLSEFINQAKGIPEDAHIFVKTEGMLKDIGSFDYTDGKVILLPTVAVEFVAGLRRLYRAIEDNCKKNKVPCKECEKCSIKNYCSRINKQ